MDFVTSIKTCLGKYATFQGRASRSEYWYFTLFLCLVSVVTQIAAAVAPILGLLGFVVLALVIPGIAVAVRRLHDGDRSGWWYLLFLIPLIGGIVLLIWFCKRGTAGDNRFGGDPVVPAAEALTSAA